MTSAFVVYICVIEVKQNFIRLLVFFFAVFNYLYIELYLTTCNWTDLPFWVYPILLPIIRPMQFHYKSYFGSRVEAIHF